MKNKFLKFSTLGFLIITLLFSLSSCLKDEDAKKRADEKLVIENYISVNHPGAQPTSTGLYVIPLDSGGVGATPELYDYVIINYVGKTLEGKIFDASDSTQAANASISNNTWMAYNGPLKISLLAFYADGVKEGLTHMKVGGTYKLVMPSILAFNDYQPIIFEVKLLKVIKDPKAFEAQQIQQYVAKWNSDTITKVPIDSTIVSNVGGVSGLYINPYILKDTTTLGALPTDLKTVTVNYKMRLLAYSDGNNLNISERFIQKSDNFKFKLGTGNVIAGFEGAVKNIHLGESVRVIIPYYRAYGAGAKVDPSTYRIVIPQYSTLVYDLKVVKIE